MVLKRLSTRVFAGSSNVSLSRVAARFDVAPPTLSSDFGLWCFYSWSGLTPRSAPTGGAMPWLANSRAESSGVVSSVLKRDFMWRVKAVRACRWILNREKRKEKEKTLAHSSKEKETLSIISLRFSYLPISFFFFHFFSRPSHCRSILSINAWQCSENFVSCICWFLSARTSYGELWN